MDGTLQQLVAGLWQYAARNRELETEVETLKAALEEERLRAASLEKRLASARERIEYKTVEEWELEQAAQRENGRADQAAELHQPAHQG